MSEADVIISVDYTSVEPNGENWHAAQTGAMGDDEDWFHYKAQATNWARNRFHQAADKGYLTNLLITGIDGQEIADSWLGPGARGGDTEAGAYAAAELRREDEDGPRCEPTEKGPKLTPAQRDDLPDSAFAVVYTDQGGTKHRDYPLTNAQNEWDPYHATLALSFLNRTWGRHYRDGTSEARDHYRWEATQVLRKVREHFPGVWDCEEDLVEKAKDRYDLIRI